MSEASDRVWSKELAFRSGGDVGEGCRRLSGLLEELDDYLASIQGLTGVSTANLRLLCDELGSNIIRHSASRGNGASLRFEAERVEGALRLRVRDNGGAFNPFDQPPPYLGGDLDKRRVGGLGLYLIKELFPQAVYRRFEGWNEVEVECRFEREQV